MPVATAFESRYAELHAAFRRLARPLCHKRGFDPDPMTIEDAIAEMLTYCWQHWSERPDDDAVKLAVWAFGRVWRRVAALAWDVDSLDETHPDSSEPVIEPEAPHHTGDDSHATAVDVAALVEWFNPMARRVLAMLATGRSGRAIQRALGLGERAARNTIAAIRSVVASVVAGVTVVIPKRLRRNTAGGVA